LSVWFDSVVRGLRTARERRTERPVTPTPSRFGAVVSRPPASPARESDERHLSAAASRSRLGGETRGEAIVATGAGGLIAALAPRRDMLLFKILPLCFPGSRAYRGTLLRPGPIQATAAT
jgi:hypothetical protein